MAWSAFGCALLVILITGQFETSSAFILDGTPPTIHTGNKDEIAYILNIVTVIHTRQTEIEHYLHSLNNTLFNVDYAMKALDNEILNMASNITMLKSESSDLRNELKLLNQTVMNFSNNLNSTTTDVEKLKTQVTSLVTKNTELETKFSNINSTLVNMEARNVQKIEELKTNFTTEVTSLKAENALLKSEMRELRHNVTHLGPPSAPLGSLPSDVNATMAEVKKLKEENKVIQHEAANLLRQVIDVKADVKAIQEQRNKSVMFMAHFSTNQTNVRNDTALVFDKAELNVGHAYNKASGKFVAPMLGVYMFHSQIQGHNDGVVYVRMRKNGEDVAEIYTAKDDGKRDESGSTHALLLLGTGDEVWMQRAGDADSYYGNFRSHFTGYMLKAL